MIGRTGLALVVSTLMATMPANSNPVGADPPTTIESACYFDMKYASEPAEEPKDPEPEVPCEDSLRFQAILPPGYKIGKNDGPAGVPPEGKNSKGTGSYRDGANSSHKHMYQTSSWV